ncbi:hypothetical protein CRG98_039058 [Punica granatum]|uniref:Retrovirus-related Pol polyprotein from transposon TNT 1-94 n=1 Tax=Punica granatum TaxID=22663 RepID=A0A2I0I9Q7_PUNGR|nr:hypothetical protein CRG98_039058 [Punica granatum]
MSGTKFEVEKFDGSNDFEPWKIKIKALLVQHGLEGALEGEKKLTATLSLEERKMVMLKARSSIQLSLSNKFPWEAMQSLLDTECDHADLFNQIVMDLTNVGVEIQDKDLTLLLLCPLQEAYGSFVDTMLYSRTSITLEDVKASLNSKEL